MSTRREQFIGASLFIVLVLLALSMSILNIL